MLIAVEQFDDLSDMAYKLTPEFYAKLNMALRIASMHSHGKPVKLCIGVGDYPPLSKPSLSETPFGEEKCTDQIKTTIALEQWYSRR